MVILTVIVALAISGCVAAPSPQPSVLRPEVEVSSNPMIEFNDSNTWTVGNNSYVTLNIYATQSDKAALILSILKMFEDDKPDLQMLNWKIEESHSASCSSNYIYGLWIHHKPKQ